MKKNLLLLFLLLFTFSLQAKKSGLDSLFMQLDKAIENSEKYAQVREKKIEDYKQMFSIPDLSFEQRYKINRKLYDLYYSYQPDSAIAYMKENIIIASALKDNNKTIEAKLHLCASYTLKGFFIDALDLIKSIDRNELEGTLLRDYYSKYIHLLSHYPYSQNKDKAHLLKLYQDSLTMLLDKNSPQYLEHQASKLLSKGKCSEAREILFSIYKDVEPYTHKQAMMAHNIAGTYRCDGNYDMQKKYYAIAAIADIKSGVKENAAIRALAAACYETNDIDRAYRYIYKSMEDAVFANVSLRLIQATQIFPIIEKSYQQKMQKQQNRLYVLVVFIGLLSFFLIIAVIYVTMQMKKLRKARQALSEANSRLNELNESLEKSNEEKTLANKEIRRVNKELSEANLLKETYISQFLTICSVYIKKLEKYQNSLNKKAMEKQLDDLYKMLKSRDMIEQELKELYHLFDTIFLDLYPDFIEEFNLLFSEENRFHMKPAELLNTELRIFALIRLGITDSSQIADFLHYSLATIYNYRTRIRNKSFFPNDKFESMVMKIGIIK